MSRSHAEPAAVELAVHAKSDLRTNMSLDMRDGDANARVEAAWRRMGAADTTHVAIVEPRPELPPRDLSTRQTSKWLPAVVFCGQPVRFAADRPLPLDCSHTLADWMDQVEADLTIDRPASAAAPSVAAVRNGRSSVPGSGEGPSSAGERPAFTREVAR